MSGRDNFDWSKHAEDWPPEQAAEWKRAYSADEPVILPYAEHGEGECGHCDLLRLWMSADLDEGESADPGSCSGVSR